MEHRPDDKDALPRLSTPMAVSFYLGMLFVAMLWSALTEPGLELLLRAPALRAIPWWGAGVGVGVVLVFGTMIAEPIFPAMRQLVEELAPIVAPFDAGRVLTLAICSGVAEEALFRGPCQHTLGYVVTSVLFALLHGGFSRRYIAWSTFALVAGLSFGLLVQAYGSVWPAVLAHIVVNAINLRRLGRMQANTGLDRNEP